MIDFTQPNEYQYWTAVNDNVMGGISTGLFTYDGNVSQFTGELSLANNGGFSSVNRTISPLTMSPVLNPKPKKQKIKLKIKK